ncbi:11133_t:CDS:2 [Acaulospora morrowiae]|uniref:11133_t:CDS:1 n=1 Tax=Acaulospora morrowiae TaxID=94023 RepID=A0A9N8Z799_9GLOM|nr:11133_t:CDS:2 [Acaulospora morrowiae]
MPELPEVHRAERACNHNMIRKRITKVETQQDNLVFCGITNKEFETSILNKIVVDTGRWGKYFYFILNEKPHPVFHFGMAGDIRFKDQDAFSYRRKKSKNDSEEWPPRFWKLVITLEDVNDKSSPSTTMAFTDERRLARVRLVDSALTDPPISKLGFDPLNNMLKLEDFGKLILKRRCPIKALLLDQSFSAGIGNWIADEVLYQSKIHPSQYTNTLSSEQISALHEKIVYVCQTAVDANAEASSFPNSWLFHYRWGKGNKDGTFMPDGEQIIFQTVGGRTSAIVPSAQVLVEKSNDSSRASENSKSARKRKAKSEKSPTESPPKSSDVKDTVNKSKKKRSRTKET